MNFNPTKNWQATDPIWEKFKRNPLLDQIHVIRVNVPKNIETISEVKNLLSASELEKLNRIVRQQDKDTFLVSNLMKKILCGKYLNILPEEVRLAEGDNKKPYLPDHPNLHFNTSHSGDWVVFIFSNYPCGIDLEKIQWDFDSSGVMDISFHQQEKEFVLQSANPLLSFFRIWTMKESLLKATGKGLIDNLPQLNMLEAPTHLENNAPWQIKSFLIDNDYWCSICMQQMDLEIKYFEF